MEVPVHIINAFTIGNTGGNPAGVVLNADALSSSDKQQIAARLGLAETAFVSSSRTAAIKLDFFTPVRQIPHCGHATIAVFSYLKQQGLLVGETSSKETIDGNRDIFFDGGRAFMEQTAPTYVRPEADYPFIYGSLNLTEEDLEPGLFPTIVNTGNSFLIIAVKNETVLRELTPDQDQIKVISERYQLIGYYVYTQSDQPTDLQATARMFGPAYGIPEESATGMAAGPLAAYLYHMGNKQSTYRIEQGRFMQPPSPSLITVTLQLTDGQITSLYAGGNATLMGQRMVDM